MEEKENARESEKRRKDTRRIFALFVVKGAER